MANNNITRLIRNIFTFNPTSLNGVVNQGISKFDELIRKLIAGVRTGVWRKDDNGKFLREAYTKMDMKQKKKFRQFLRAEADTNPWLQKEAENIKLTARNIAQKISRGRPITTFEQEFIDDFGDFLMKDKYIGQEAQGNPVNSSWIISASWVGDEGQTGNMFVQMKRGRDIYKFYGVPKAVWIMLTELEANAGTWWWNNWIWKYSAYAKNWNKKTKKG